jgi:hypothetical protein
MNIVAEEMTRNIAQTSYWQIDKENSDGYKSYMPMMMDFSLMTISSLHSMRKAVGFQVGKSL